MDTQEVAKIYRGSALHPVIPVVTSGITTVQMKTTNSHWYNVCA